MRRKLLTGALLWLFVAVFAQWGVGEESGNEVFGGGEPPDLHTTGTTVITHGYQLSDDIPDWPYHIAEAIRSRVVEGGGDARIFVNNRATGAFDPCAHPVCGPQGLEGETILVFDWADDSNESGEGYSEAAAESLFADLVQWSRGDDPLVVLDHLHLIGHSRGTVVNSEVAERLIAARYPAPEQVTNLDPHDSGALREEQLSWEDFDKEGSGGADISGWSFHGGGGSAAVDTVGDNNLRLDAGEWRRHNRFLMPPNAKALRFCRQVVDSGNSAVFSVLLLQESGVRVLFEEGLNVETGWLCFEPKINEDEQGLVSRLEVSLSDNGGGAEVRLDDLRIWAPLFADGFESGDVSAW